MALKYLPYKFFNYPEQLKAVRNKSVVAPVHVRIKPINACNHSCWFCAYRAENLQLGNEMKLSDRIPAEKMQEIVNDLIEMNVQAVTFSGGGEPLLYPELSKYMIQLGKAGVRLAALTNGSYLKDEVAESFAKYGSWVRVSMDGWDNESYTRFRKAKAGEYDKIVANMREFVKLNSKCVIGVSFVIGKENHHHIYQFCKDMKEIGVDHVKLSAAVVSNSGKENNEYHMEFKNETLELVEQALTLIDSDFQVMNHYHDLNERFEKDYQYCPFLQFLTIIGADSMVYTCQDKAYTELGRLGSIENRSFADFWYSSENRKRIYDLNPSVDCRHHCVSHQKNLIIHEYMQLDPDHIAFV